MSPQPTLMPAEAGEYISRLATHVSIREEGLDKLADQIVSAMSDDKLVIPDCGAAAADIHVSRSHPRAADWVFVVDALNFCFWSPSHADKWTVDGHTGYYALEAALLRAIKEGCDITNPEYYSKITADEARHIMRGDSAAQIPLLEERVAVLRESGRVLVERFAGSFAECVRRAGGSAAHLLRLVLDHFPSFRDEADYGGRRVAFYKRAQILICDLWNTFEGKGLGEFEDIDTMTMFADYRVPQVLLHFGALAYSDRLMDKLRNDDLLPSGSEEEVEIRGCSLHAVELVRARVAALLRGRGRGEGAPNSALLDYYLWCYRRQHAAALEDVPFHKTLGIYY